MGGHLLLLFLGVTINTISSNLHFVPRLLPRLCLEEAKNQMTRVALSNQKSKDKCKMLSVKVVAAATGKGKDALQDDDKGSFQKLWDHLTFKQDSNAGVDNEDDLIPPDERKKGGWKLFTIKKKKDDQKASTSGCLWSCAFPLPNSTLTLRSNYLPGQTLFDKKCNEEINIDSKSSCIQKQGDQEIWKDKEREKFELFKQWWQ